MSKLKFTTSADLCMEEARVEITPSQSVAPAVFYVHQDGGVRASFMVDADDLRLMAAMCSRMADELEGLCEDTSHKPAKP